MLGDAVALAGGLISLTVAGVALWGAIEGVYYIFCKITGRTY